jgi:MerR family transcriptional regulator, thiopeptide resistance regulator
MNHPLRFYSPIETAKRLNVTTKALRYYEQKGLVEPLRTTNGWRTYGPAQMVRLHQVLALKRLGLSLLRIAKLMSGQLGDLDAVLAVQEVVLRRQLTNTKQALTLLLAARQKLAAGEKLSSDDILNLTRKTVMQDQVSENEVTRIVQDAFERHISPEERQRLQANNYQPTASSSTWEALHAEASALMVKGDTGSPEAMDLARRWMLEVNRATGGDPALNQKVRAMWQEALQNPAVQAQAAPNSLEMMTFVSEAYQKALAAGVASYPS